MEAPFCPGCRQRDTLIAQQQERLAQLEARVRELEARLGQNASNSSLPPSANPPQAPKPVRKRRSRRKRGGQPGHPGALRDRRPPERLKDTIHYRPATCGRCQAPLPAQAGPDDPEPLWHQVAELPDLTAEITEYQAHGRRCPCCGEITWARIPPEIRAHSTGPRLTAFLSYLTGSHQVSRRGAGEIAATAFDAPLALGTVSGLEGEMSAALAPAHGEAGAFVRQAASKHVDETGWKEAGHKAWLWTAATATVAFFVIHARRNWQGLKALLGATIQGIICSDRWSVYDRLVLACRQICWAHLKRDFQKCVDRGGASVRLGKKGLALVRQLFVGWHAYRGGGRDPPGHGDRARLQAELAPVQQQLQRLLRRGRGCADEKAATFCANLLKLWPALWTFVREAGVEPTNNHAERVLRRGVLWRKRSFGSGSDRGSRFVERMLTVVQTLRLQKRRVFDYLYEALVAHRAAQPAPKLLLSD
jgi:transposase